MDTNFERKNNTNVILIVMIVIIIVMAFLLWNSSKNSGNEYQIILKGNRYIILNEDETFTEPGYTALQKDVDVTDNVIVTNEIKNVPGIYKVIYQIGNYYEYRYVEVKAPENTDIELKLNTNEKTKDDVIINVTVYGNIVSLTLPDGSIINSKTTSYVAKDNGTYTFIVVDDKNETVKKEITVNNIDREVPMGTCAIKVENNNTIITVDVTNEEKVTYSYYENDNLLTTNNSNTYTISNRVASNIKVKVEDEVLNTTEINCSNNSHEPVIPAANENIVYHGDSETLKAYIVRRNGYLLTYIWVKDAYTQLNKSDSPEYGSKLYYPKELMNKANTNNNLTDKIMIGFNASGFYLKGSYDIESVNAYPAYNKTSVGTLVITNGKVIRNAYDHAVKTWYTIGVNKENKLLVFEDLKTDNISEKQKWAQSVIDSGIRNTFTFAAPIMQNGVKTNITTSMPGNYSTKKGLQIMCQINENNFILFTSSNESRDHAITEFTKLGCQTAMNLDGGGSIALMYKDKNTNEIVKVIGGSRELPEIGYFTE